MNSKEIQRLNMPWEKDYQYAQGIKSGNTVWLAGQLGHDGEGKLAEGMEAQVRLSYTNIKNLLAAFNFVMDDVVEEVLYVLDMPAAFEATKKVRQQFYPHPDGVATTIVAVSGLALPGQLIEIKIVARQ
ncbi:MAG: Rid family hydrolase [Bacteroidota bacterium]